MDEAKVAANGGSCEDPAKPPARVVSLSETGLLSPASAQELTERMELVTSIRDVQRRSKAMQPVVRALQSAEAKAEAAERVKRLVIPKGVPERPAKFFALLAKHGEIGRAAQELGIDGRSGNIWRWKRRWPEVYKAAQELGAMAVARRHAAPDWEDVESELATLVMASGHKDQLRAIELWARLDGRLDTKLQIEVSRTKLEAKLQEALTNYGVQVAKALPSGLSSEEDPDSET